MEQYRALLFIIVALLLPLGVAGSVSAATISVEQELHVTARVLPMRHIIVDQTGEIIEITSNTSQDVTPEVFLLTDKPENRRPLTASLRQKHDMLVAARQAQPGILYSRADISSVNSRMGKPQQNSRNEAKAVSILGKAASNSAYYNYN